MKIGQEPGHVQWTEDPSKAVNITKRELFAAMAMQGQLAGICSNGDPGNFADLKELAGGWLAAADALLEEFDK